VDAVDNEDAYAFNMFGALLTSLASLGGGKTVDEVDNEDAFNMFGADDAQEEEVGAQGKKPRKQRANVAWSIVEYRGVTLSRRSKEEIDEALKARTKKALNNLDLSLHQPRYARGKEGEYVTPYRCRFYGQENGACPFRCRVIEHADGTCTLEEAGVHTEHDVYTGKKALSLAIKAKCCNASLSKTPDELVHYARDNFDLPPVLMSALDTPAGANGLQRYRGYVTRKGDAAGRKGDAASCSYAAVEQWCEQNERAKLVLQPGFKDHTVYVVSGWEIDSETAWVTYVLTSEKLMTNLWHIKESGMPVILCVDTTHRLVAEGHSVFVCGVRDIAQKFHKVAYGVQHSDKAVAPNAHMLRMVAKEYLRVKERMQWS